MKDDPFAELFAQWDEGAKSEEEFNEELLQLCEPIICLIAKKTYSRVFWLDRDDLAQEARVVVITRAVKNFERTKPFRPYVRRCIQNKMRCVARAGAPRSYWEGRKRIALASWDFMQVHGRLPLTEELPALTGLPLEEVEAIQRAEPVIENHESLDDDERLDATAENPESTAISAAGLRCVLKAIMAGLDQLPRQQREVVLLHAVDNWSFNEIAAKLVSTDTGTAMTENNARQIYARALRKLSELKESELKEPCHEG
jgi:RNA polymerase sigma factor (sigma-70 family)